MQQFKTVQKDWVRKHKENIQLRVLKENYLEGRTEPINTLEEKQRFQRGLAKRRKERLNFSLCKNLNRSTIQFFDHSTYNEQIF